MSLFLGFSSGLPLPLTSSVLQAWYATSQVSLLSISFVGLASLPYTLKFFWAPLMDRYIPPFLGRRRGWVLICQLLLACFLVLMTFYSPQTHPQILLGLACVVAFLSASQDIAVDAYRVDLLSPGERPMGAAMTVNGYRVALLVAGGLVLVLAEFWGWPFAYITMAVLMILSTGATLLGPEPEQPAKPPVKLLKGTLESLTDFLNRPQALWILVFVVCYKLGDAFAGSLCVTFLIRAVHMTLLEIGTLIKISGFVGTLVGTFLGALWMPKLGFIRALIIFGFFQALANLFYLPLLWTGPNYVLAGCAIFGDNLFGGMATAAFLSLLMSLCNPQFTAFQFALLSALSAVGRVFISPVAGSIAETFGWEAFFMASLLFALPGLILLYWFRNDFEWHFAEAEKSTS